MDAQVQAKIEKLKELYQDEESQKDLSDIERAIRTKIAQQGIKELDPIKDVIAETEKKINSINALLQFDEKLTDIERKLMFKERSVLQFFLDRFNGADAEKRINALKAFLDERIALAERELL